MPTVSESLKTYADATTQYQDAQDVAITEVGTEIKALNDLITQLQNSPGQITPADQALLDQLQQRGQGLTQKIQALEQIAPPPPPNV